MSCSVFSSNVWLNKLDKGMSLIFAYSHEFVSPFFMKPDHYGTQTPQTYGMRSICDTSFIFLE